jgi:AcrR family transcriptional regulator
MSAKKTDRRTQRTRHQLGHALVELVKEKRFDDITVQEVIDRADVGRSTFYTHFRDKEDLFQKDWERFLDALAQHIEWDKAGSGSFVPVAHLFAHLQDYQKFYRGLERSRKVDAVFKHGVEYFGEKIAAALTSRLEYSPAAAVPTAVLANFISQQLFGLLKWWLDQGMPYAPERMDQMFHQLVNPTVQAQLSRATIQKPKRSERDK